MMHDSILNFGFMMSYSHSIFNGISMEKNDVYVVCTGLVDN